MPHDTFELQKALDKDEYTSNFNPKVTSADEGLAFLEKNSGRHLLIANTDPSGLPGTHWVLFFRRNSSHPPIFFDSYGKNLATTIADGDTLTRAVEAMKTCSKTTPPCAGTTVCTWRDAWPQDMLSKPFWKVSNRKTENTTMRWFFL